MTGPYPSLASRSLAGLAVLLFLLGAGLSPARADDKSLKRLSKTLVELRSTVDDLNSQLRVERTQNLLELRELQRRKEELALLKDAEAVKQATLKQQLQRRQEKQAKEQDTRSLLARAVEIGRKQLAKAVERSLPYRLKERLAAISELGLRMGAGRIDPAAAAVKLWRLVEDELRLAMTVERAEVPLVIDGKSRLVRVVRLGTVTLYTSLGPEEYGRFVRRQDGTWHHVVLEEPQHCDQIAALFRALERQVREGFYRLPLPDLIQGGKP
jgi:hypothetical protein